MTINNIAIKNIKGNLNKYAMYYLSNVIVVTIFFIFANFIYNPGVSSSNISDKTISDAASRLMYLCEFVIIIFTFIFSNYSITSFLKSREKEFGLLSMFGLTKGQIRQYVMFENVIISIFSIITGLFFGILFSKLFFMAMSVILDLNTEMPFLISSKAIKITILSFFILLNIISFITSRKIKNNNIAELLKGERIPKTTPKFSKFKSVLAIILIISGYIVGLFSGTAIIMTMFPILIVVIIGTKLLFSQFSVFFTNKLQNNKGVYYKGINMITLSQIIYKLKDNAKVLFITSILSGITLASAISVYSLQKVSLSSMEENCPQDIGVMEQGINSHKVIADGKIEEILEKYKFNIKYKNKTELIRAKNNDKVVEDKKSTYGIKVNKTDFNIMSENSFNDLAKQYNKKPLTLNNGDAIVYTYDLTNNIVNQKTDLPFKSQKKLNLNIGGKINSFNILDNLKGGIINADIENTNTIIVSNSDFKKLGNNLSDDNKFIYYGYNIKHNLKAVNAITEIKNSVAKGQEALFTERVISAAGLMQILSVLLFIGTFVAMIFFIATGSILYFKMFNEVQKDKQDFIGLKKIGVTQEEIKKIVSIQSFTMFFLPLTVATLHAAFAVKSVGLLYTKYFIFIAGIYLVLQIVYYLFAKWMYMKQINSWNI
ncbi:ABC transporter permease [Clostridium sporogenes]|uniref:ABC transporter permease n=1 Tax=Clostridium botulinum TaxID=1491 RepID=A0A6M0SY61_CLOBO|nr:ABC transporter permease [Clostridium sporogenes]NFA59885.1 ABC transporter permease [Clostridium botulinum]NFI74042.1 ABC transporter permease [Clostridium sporogenes]NFL71756.1 ABC transporter permease [Clostridium sporogenes]NFM24612.1 ABC transporter permease [Clostridium sporogenes]NFP61916.1 ABC transporter permease [Clostridium sporogenes]